MSPKALVCPVCGNDQVYRSRRRNLWERLRGWLTQRRPYRCSACPTRFWGP